MGRQLTVLSFGGGQDSTYILYRIIKDPEFRKKWVKGDFIVVMSDTGNEHFHTYGHIQFIQKLCYDNGIEFYFLTLGEYHPNTWPTLVHQLKLHNTIMSLAGPRTCTDNLKIKPIYNFIDHYVAMKYYGYDKEEKPKGKSYIKRFAKENGKIRVIIGIAHGEEKRIKTSTKREKKAMQTNAFKRWVNPVPYWFRVGVEKVYPLIGEEIARWNIHEYIRDETDWPLPYPSNCMFCPYMTQMEILWMYRNYPGLFEMWVELEANKIKKCEGNGKRNLGVKGEKLLPEILREAIAQYGHMTDEQLNEHKMSHGHCVMSKY